MTITSISSVINPKFLQRIGAATGGQSSSATGGNSASQTTLTGLSNGARVFTNALSGLNSLISFVNITRQDLLDFKEITTEMIQVVGKATRAGIGQNVRSSLNGKFEDLVIDFKKKVSELSGREYDGTQKAKLEEIFALLGFDAKSSKGFADLLDQFSFFDNEKGEEVLASDLSQARRPVRIPQSALQATVRNVYANGNGSFYARTSSVIAGSSNMISSALGDANNDGVDEVAFLDAAGVAYVSRKDADGTFRTTVSVALTSHPINSTLHFRDVNNDGYDDLVTTSNDGDGTSVFSNVALSNGDGSFQTPIRSSFVNSTTLNQTAMADFDEDGFLDLVSYSSSDGLIVQRGAGDGTFSIPFSPLSAYVTPGGPDIIETGDIDGDGNQDMVIKYGDGFTVVKGNGDGTFAEGVSYSFPSGSGDFVSNLGKMSLADITGDGRADLVFGDPANTSIRVWVNDGLGTYSASAVIGGTGETNAVFTRDVNNDGIQDIVAYHTATSKIYTAFGNGDGTFQGIITSTISRSGSTAVVGDFNNDGLTDILIGNDLAGGQSGFSTVDSLPTSVEAPGLRSSGEDFKTLFASRRNIITRPAAFRMLADIKALETQIDENLGAIEKAFNYVYDNMKMIRQVGLSFLDAAKEVEERSVTDPEAIASVLQQKIRNGAKSSLGFIENLENIVAVTISRASKSSSTSK